MMPAHQIVGVPIRITCLRQVLPAGASQPRVPGSMPVSAATPTGPVEEQPARRLGRVGVARAVQEVRVEGVDVLVVVPERAQRLGHLAEAARVVLARRRPALAVVVEVVLGRLGLALVVHRHRAGPLLDELGVLRRGQRALVLVGVDQPPGPRRRVDDRADHHEVHERRGAVGDDRAHRGPPDPERAPRARAPQPDQDPEPGERVDRRPLGADRQAPADAAGQQPRAGRAAPGPGRTTTRR